MTEDRPLVAVSLRPQAKVVDGETVLSSVGNFAKVLECLHIAGVTPIAATASTDLSRVSAVVIPGGGDISPARYGGTPNETTYDVDDEQDEIDFALVAYATAHDLPLLGICRGAQLINVARGGTLYEDLPNGSDAHHNSIATSDYENVFVSHTVHINARSHTASALRDVGNDSAESLEIPVRSAHHQSVRSLGSGLRITARAGDGTVEAFEASTGWTVAVQWHPEAELTDGILKQGLFTALAGEISRRRGHVLEQDPVSELGTGSTPIDLISTTP